MLKQSSAELALCRSAALVKRCSAEAVLCRGGPVPQQFSAKAVLGRRGPLPPAVICRSAACVWTVECVECVGVCACVCPLSCSHTLQITLLLQSKLFDQIRKNTTPPVKKLNFAPCAALQAAPHRGISKINRATFLKNQPPSEHSDVDRLGHVSGTRARIFV